MKAEEYVENGLVLDYCLGLLINDEKLAFEKALESSPMLAEELRSIQEGLNKYVAAYSLTPPYVLKDKIWGTLENLLLEAHMDLSNLPVINEFSDPKVWMDAVRPLLPKTLTDGRFMHVLTHTDNIQQVLVMTATDVEDEVHSDVYESFIILEGECECHIGNDTVIRVKAGGYVRIPMHEHHDLKIISPYVIGIMQRIAA